LMVIQGLSISRHTRTTSHEWSSVVGGKGCK
jgi:hypothetical protein